MIIIIFLWSVIHDYNQFSKERKLIRKVKKCVLLMLLFIIKMLFLGIWLIFNNPLLIILFLYLFLGKYNDDDDNNGSTIVFQFK